MLKKSSNAATSDVVSAAELPRPVLWTVDNVACVLQKGSSEASASVVLERPLASSCS